MSINYQLNIRSRGSGFYSDYVVICPHPTGGNATASPTLPLETRFMEVESQTNKERKSKPFSITGGRGAICLSKSAQRNQTM